MLQNQLQTSKQEIEQLKNRIESLRQTNIDNEKESTQIVTNNDFNKDDLPWTFTERQQGEVINLYFTK
jgi:predicted RNase H-like nuclease (RuvC/YqgF family)